MTTHYLNKTHITHLAKRRIYTASCALSTVQTEPIRTIKRTEMTCEACFQSLPTQLIVTCLESLFLCQSAWLTKILKDFLPSSRVGLMLNSVPYTLWVKKTRH